MNADHPLFSVIIPAYNAAPWLGLTLGSWVTQTEREFELIVVDDGSDDATVAVAEQFHDRLNLRVIRERRSGGPAHPCNVGIKEARGELIVHCDADDLALPDRLERIRQAWDDAGHRDCLLISDFAEIDEHGAAIRPAVLPHYSALREAKFERLSDETMLFAPEAAFAALLQGSFIRPCSAATPKRLLLEIGGFNEALRNAQDYDLYLRIAREYPVVMSRRVLALYRMRPGNISSRSAIELAPSKFAIFRHLVASPLTRSQRQIVQRCISANYDAVGYEYGERGEVLNSVYAYWRAFVYRPHWSQFRGIAASIVKFAIRRKR